MRHSERSGRSRGMPVLLALLSFFLIAGEAHPDASSGAEPSPKDKCPVCGMFVARYPDWTARAVLGDGRVFHFDGAKDLFRFVAGPERYLAGSPASPVRSLWVKDYYSLTMIDARKAHYVVGSNIIGPMGHELIPFQKRSDAVQFLNDHKGRKVLGFKDITGEVLGRLD